MSRISLPLVAVVLAAVPFVHAQEASLPADSAQESAELRKICEKTRDAQLLKIKATDEKLRAEITALPEKLNSPELDAVHAHLPKLREANTNERRSWITVDFLGLGLNPQQAARAAEIYLKSKADQNRPNSWHQRKILNEVLGRELTSIEIEALEKTANKQAISDAELQAQKFEEKAFALSREFGVLINKLESSKKWENQVKRLSKENMWLHLSFERVPTGSRYVEDISIVVKDFDDTFSTHSYRISNPSKIETEDLARGHRVKLPGECYKALNASTPRSSAITESKTKTSAPLPAAKSGSKPSADDATAGAAK
ncbi:MAG: hypothetical protein NDJ90_13005 [Oligoflexia bacterium]|nr:hypothetical protein [Oligoflexia bacterium]